MQKNHARYRRGICLIYGDKPALIRNISNAVRYFVEEDDDASNIEIWHHASVGSQARHITINGTKDIMGNQLMAVSGT